MLFGSEVWCLRHNELDILKKAMVRAIFRVKLSGRFKSKSLIDRFCLKETLETLAKSLKLFGLKRSIIYFVDYDYYY